MIEHVIAVFSGPLADPWHILKKKDSQVTKWQRGTNLSVLAELQPPAWLGSSMRLCVKLSSALPPPGLSMDAASSVHPFGGGGGPGVSFKQRTTGRGRSLQGPKRAGIEAVQWLE